MQEYFAESRRKGHPTYDKRKAKRIGHILRVNCLIEGNVL